MKTEEMTPDHMRAMTSGETWRKVFEPLAVQLLFSYPNTGDAFEMYLNKVRDLYNPETDGQSVAFIEDARTVFADELRKLIARVTREEIDKRVKSGEWIDIRHNQYKFAKPD